MARLLASRRSRKRRGILSTVASKITLHAYCIVVAVACYVAVTSLRYRQQAVGIFSSQKLYSSPSIASANDSAVSNNNYDYYKNESTSTQAQSRAALVGVDEESPLFVLSLPNSGSNALQRYFHCAGLEPSKTLGRYSINPARRGNLQEIGRCMHNNLQTNKTILNGCGNFKVWLDMDIARNGVCHYPSIKSLDALFRQFPNATILQAVQDPNEWYETLSYDLKELWPNLCQESHPTVTFPGPLSDREVWIDFYNWHVNHLRQFCEQNPSWRYIEINLDVSPDDTATKLQKQLGVDTHCWKDSVHRPGLVPPQPNDITYPLLVAALSKSGTTTVHNYFSCGLGGGTSIHTFTKNQTTQEVVPLGYCLEYNIQNDRPLFQECSYYKVYSDVQFLSPPRKGRCFLPTLQQNGGLQNFHKHYPRGTLLHVHRNASGWYQSAKHYHNLVGRWSNAVNCHGVPPPNSTEEAWIDFYEGHTQWVRQFAQEHPSLTYIEVELEDPNTPNILERVFGIPTFCWKASNVNRKVASEN